MKAASIQETPATEINKKHLPPAKRTILMPRTVTKMHANAPLSLIVLFLVSLVASELSRRQHGLKCRFLAYQSASMRGVNYLKAQSVLSGVLSVLAQLPLSAAYTP